MKSGGFQVKSTQNLINSDVSAKTLQFGWISCGFHEIRRISCEIERPLTRNCNPMFLTLNDYARGFYGQGGSIIASDHFSRAYNNHYL